MDILVVLLYLLFVAAAVILTVVILLQEGKGGGFGDALGTAGQQAFGVKASGVQKFTMWVAAVFLGSAIAIHILNKNSGEFEVSAAPAIEAPAIGAPTAGAPGLDLDGRALELR